MNNNIENEIRGKLSDVEYERTIDYLESKNCEKQEFDRFSIRYAQNDISETKVDIRIREQEGRSEIIMKLGAFAASNRIEIPVEINKDSFENGVKFLANLGYDKGFALWRLTKVYKYKGVDVVLVIVPNHSKYFELEILSSEKDQNIALNKLQEIKNELKLTQFRDEEDYFKYGRDLDNSANIKFQYGKSDLSKLRKYTDRIWYKKNI